MKSIFKNLSLLLCFVSIVISSTSCKEETSSTSNPTNSNQPISDQAAVSLNNLGYINGHEAFVPLTISELEHYFVNELDVSSSTSFNHEIVFVASEGYYFVRSTSTGLSIGSKLKVIALEGGGFQAIFDGETCTCSSPSDAECNVTYMCACSADPNVEVSSDCTKSHMVTASILQASQFQ
tara:strand:- start:147 stop:686 length:540 start_codon:yes stop_codon:yes gene_type:complete